MPYGILFLSLFLLPHTYCSSEASFKPISPITPKLGDDVYLVCKLKAPKGDKFHGTTPDLITDGVEPHFRFTDIRNYIFDSRFNGFEIVDPASLELEGILSIKAINPSDLSRHFTCFQTLIMSGKKVSSTITLGTFVHTTTSSNTPELTSTTKPDTTHLPPPPPTTTTDTGDVPINSTHFQLEYKQILATIAIMLAIFFACKIPCCAVFIYKVIWPKLIKWTERRRLDQPNIQYTTKYSKQITVLSPSESQQVSKKCLPEESN